MQVINDNILNSFLVLVEILVFLFSVAQCTQKHNHPRPCLLWYWPRCGMKLQDEGGQGFQWSMLPVTSKLEEEFHNGAQHC